MQQVVIVNSEGLGHGSDELGKQLMGAFLKKIWASDTKPQQIVFYNSGVKLLGPGSALLDVLNGLFDCGVDLVACGTCAAYFKLDDKLTVGRISNMQEIVSILMDCDKVITI